MSEQEKGERKEGRRKGRRERRKEKGVEKPCVSKTYLTVCVRAKSPQSCPALCDPIDCSMLGSSVHGIIQARILEWFAMSSSRGFF